MAAPSPDLVFTQTPLAGTPTPLVFGDADFTAPSVAVDIAVTLGGVSVAGLVVIPVRVSIAVTLGGVSAAAAVVYDNRVTRYRDQRAAVPHQTGLPFRLDESDAWQTSLNKLGGKEMPWDKAARRLPGTASPYQSSQPMRSLADAAWELAQHVIARAASGMQTGVAHEIKSLQPWQLGDQRRTQAASGMQTGIFRLLQEASCWQPASSVRRLYLGRSGASQRLSRRTAAAPWQTAGWPHAGKEQWPPVTPGQPPAFDWDANLLFACPFIEGTPAPLLFGEVCGSPSAPGETIIVPVRRVYMVINDARLRRVDGNIPLPVVGMQLTIDVDSWVWGFTATLPGNTLANLEPAGSGAPVEVEATINGVAYRALVESISRERSFASSELRVQGRGKTALLDAPYAPSSNFTNSVNRTAQQIMGDVLTLNGVPMGWSVAWGLEDWLVPANVFSQQGSYIAALNAIAQAAGGYIQPHASLQSLSVLPRYPTAPWTWASVTPDYELPVDVTTRESIDWVEKPRYNRVYVSGQQSGVLGQVTRGGTAGDLLAPMVTDPLITNAIAARQRGLSILSDTGRQANVSLRMPVLAETGIITPGKFVRYVDGGETRMGLVRSVSVDAGMPEVWQTIGVETHVA